MYSVDNCLSSSGNHDFSYFLSSVQDSNLNSAADLNPGPGIWNPHILSHSLQTAIAREGIL